MLAEIDRAHMVSLVVAVQAGDLAPDELVEELTEIAAGGS